MSNIFIAGHQGMVGSAIHRCLKLSDNQIITATRKELDLTNQNEVQSFFKSYQLDEVYLAAAKVGGIHANEKYPADFIYENLMIQSNVINSAYKTGVKKLLFLGSSCIYPRLSPQPMSEEELLSGKLEPTNEPYAIAKIAGIKMCESYNRQFGVDYRSVMPSNLYGPGDNFHQENSHVIPALLRKIHEAKIFEKPSVTVWGSGNAMREFLHVDDMASACVFVMNLDAHNHGLITSPMTSHINIGSGQDCSIRELVQEIIKVIGYEGEVKFDIDKPDGAPRKLMNVNRLKELGWESSVSLNSGLNNLYRWFLDNDIRK